MVYWFKVVSHKMTNTGIDGREGRCRRGFQQVAIALGLRVGRGGTGSCHPARGQQGPDLAPLGDEPFSARGRDRNVRELPWDISKSRSEPAPGTG